MITSLAATNFKSWKDTGTVPLAPITGLFGRNSSGKTSFLQLLLLLKQTAESPDRSLVLNLGDERSLVELGVFRDLVFNHGAEARLRLALGWELPARLTVPDPEHKDNFLQCVRRKATPNAPIEEGHKSVLMAHYATMSYRTGGQTLPSEKTVCM
mgnify:CR=1 FL=1